MSLTTMSKKLTAQYLQDFNRLHQSYCEEKYGEIKFQPYEDEDNFISPFILVIITDLMKREKHLMY